MSKWLTTKQASQQLGVSTRTASGQMPANVFRTQTNNELTRLLNTLKLTPNPQNKIRLPIHDKETLEALKNKELVKNMDNYFKDTNIQVKDIASSLLNLMDYAIDIKDDLMIGKVAKDLQTLFRLTEHIKGRRNG